MLEHKKNKRTGKALLKVFIFNAILLVACFTFLEWVIRDKAAFDPTLTGEMADMKAVPAKPDVSNLSFAQIGFATESPRKLSQFKNEWVIVNFWATWCAPCIKEMPSLEKLQEKYAGRGLRVIAIAMDDDLKEEELTAFLKRHKLSGLVPQYWDAGGNIYSSYRFMGYPTTWIIDPYGRQVAIYEGDADWMSKDAIALVESLLNKSITN
jgi:thiol-disulfide isomerase/thioredoxin